MVPSLMASQIYRCDGQLVSLFSHFFVYFPAPCSLLPAPSRMSFQRWSRYVSRSNLEGEGNSYLLCGVVEESWLVKRLEGIECVDVLDLSFGPSIAWRCPGDEGDVELAEGVSRYGYDLHSHTVCW